MPANIPHGETVDAEPVILALVATETVLRNAVAVVTAALLPGAVLRLPAMCTFTLPSDLLLAYLSRAPLLCRPVVLLLTLLPLLILLPLGLLLLFRGVGSLLTLLALLILLPLGLLLLFRGVGLLLTLLALLILLPFRLLLLLLALLLRGLRLLLLFRGVGLLLTLLASLILLPFGLLLLLLALLLRGLSLLLLFRLSLLLLFLGLSPLILLLLPCVSRRSDSEQQKKRGRTNNSNWFHGVTSIALTYAPVTRPIGRVYCQAYTCFDLSRAESDLYVCHPTRIRDRE
jgi:hypothetical protein